MRRAAALLLAAAAFAFAQGGTLLGVRSSTGDGLRIVVDLVDVAASALAPLAHAGRVTTDAPLRLRLPATTTAALPKRIDDVALHWQASPGATELTVAHRDAGYRVFALTEPTRLVIDLWRAPLAEAEEIWAPGVRYRRLAATGSAGESVVHAVWIEPGAGRWAVVGTPGEKRPTSALADGALLAINGGYFETTGGEPIGWWIQGGLRLGEPSRGRAAIAFAPSGEATIGRVREAVGVSIDGIVAVDPTHPWARETTRFERPHAIVGSPRQGALALDGTGRILVNRAGPLEVPEGGSVVVYPPAARALALAEPGSLVTTVRHVDPPGFRDPIHALEAGPLLAQSGVPAFDPALESFARGMRILDEPTAQAAIGRTSDGGMLLVLAERMIASDLVPLVLGLGAVDAMRLDSGSSATLVHRGVGVHRAIQRPVANAIALFGAGEP